MKSKQKTISKQKMYEYAIMETYEHRMCPQAEEEMNQIGEIPGTFEELLMKRDLFGFKRNIPEKHPFDSLGVEYVYQLCGMALGLRSYEFMTTLFDFMETHLKMFDFKSEEQLDMFFDFYYESTVKDMDFSRRMGDFILRNFDSNLENYKSVFIISYNMGNTDLDMEELMMIKRSLND